MLKRFLPGILFRTFFSAHTRQVGECIIADRPALCGSTRAVPRLDVPVQYPTKVCEDVSYTTYTAYTTLSYTTRESSPLAFVDFEFQAA